MSLQAFTASYVEALLWSEKANEEPHELQAQDLAPEAIDRINADCASFWYRATPWIGNRDAQAGHDFCLTRNGHGAGFWDGDWSEYGDILAKLSKCYGEQNLYRGDDGHLYVS